MEYSFYDFLKLLGSLALFLYGMKIMSEGLQKFAGDRLRRILTAMTTNRVTGVLTGVLITALIQSSSATTVPTIPPGNWNPLSPPRSAFAKRKPVRAMSAFRTSPSTKLWRIFSAAKAFRKMPIVWASRRPSCFALPARNTSGCTPRYWNPWRVCGKRATVFGS